MQRRGFLLSLLGGAAVAADPERLLWEPGKKLFSIPRLVQTAPFGVDFEWDSIPGIPLVDWHTQEVMRLLANKIEHAAAFKVKDFNEVFSIGETVRVRMPYSFGIPRLRRVS